jgi:hypothetical protein
MVGVYAIIFMLPPGTYTSITYAEMAMPGRLSFG